jgi:hypothetical protein
MHVVVILQHYIFVTHYKPLKVAMHGVHVGNIVSVSILFVNQQNVKINDHGCRVMPLASPCLRANGDCSPPLRLINTMTHMQRISTPLASGKAVNRAALELSHRRPKKSPDVPSETTPTVYKAALASD